MPKDYDATVKSMADLSPGDWLPLTGRPQAPVTPVDADNSVVLSGAVDRLLRVHSDPEYLLHLDFQAGHDSAQLPRRLKLYNAVQEYRYGLPVLSVAILLHPGADSPRLTGLCQGTLPGDTAPYSSLRYGVIRVWELPVERLLSGGLGLLPLAPISNVTEADVPDVLRRVSERLRRVEPPQVAADLWTSTEILLRLRYSEEFLTMLPEVLRELMRSPLVPIVAREEARKILLMQGKKRFGSVDPVVTAALNGINDLQELERLSERLLDVHSWQELFSPPDAKPEP